MKKLEHIAKIVACIYMDKIKLSKGSLLLLLGCGFSLLVVICIQDNPNVTDLGDGHFYDDTRKDILGPTRDIPPTILTFSKDEKCILAKQRPSQNNEPTIYTDSSGCYHYESGRDTIYYWIILKKEKIVYGPMVYEEYLQIKESNGITIKID